MTAPTAPYELVLGAIAAGVAATLLSTATLLALFIQLGRLLQWLALVTRIRNQVGDLEHLIESLETRHDALVGDVARLADSVARRPE